MKHILILAMILVAGCKMEAESPACKNLFSTVTGASQIISGVLQCKNTAAIAGDISAAMAKLNICTSSTHYSNRSLMSDVVCRQVSVVVSELSKSTIPHAWECSAQAVTELIKSKVAEKCAKMIK